MSPIALPVLPANEPDTSRQLELFPAANHATPSETRGVSRAAARAISPGWWPHVAELYDSPFYRDTVTVTVCHERDGVLIIEASHAGAVDWLDGVLTDIRQVTAITCGCCGAIPAHAYRATLDGPTHIACESCRERLRSGESALAIADDYFALDGSARRQPGGRARPDRSVRAPSVKGNRRACTTLPADELRRLIVEMRTSMLSEVFGQDEAVGRAALLAALHTGGGLSRGARALIVGRSGVGKTLIVSAMKKIMLEWDVVWVSLDAIDANPPGYSNAPSLGDLIASAIEGASSEAARKAVIAIDEVHHIGVVPNSGIAGNAKLYRSEMMAAMLSVTGGGNITLASGKSWSSRDALVITLGAFTDLLPLAQTKGNTAKGNRSSFSIEELVQAGLPLELASRVSEETIVLQPLSEPALVQLLRRWPALIGLSELCVRLGCHPIILPEAYTRAARAVALGIDRSTPRTAGAWLVSALRQGLIAALADPLATEIVVAADTLNIPTSATRRSPPDDPPGDAGDWDATLILSPRR